ncbi:MAG: gfo/Idh/MocA family oxidoreductase [Planctomycetota bacterium]|nr:MAG: gfo/Idh/MocA family oxidoreductase [Planctomycetota bacterium]
MIRKTTRRDFVKHTSALGAALFVGGPQAFSQERSPNERIRYACIGVSGKGDSDSSDAANHGDVVAICDIDDRKLRARKVDDRFKNAETFADYREMFEKMGDKIDAVTVSTPDHHHYLATALALSAGKAAFTQKPLTHSVWEARELARLARENDCPTQMGNQGTSNSTLRTSAAILKGGSLGPIQEVHVTTNRPVWPQGNDRPEGTDAPPFLDWDLWLGPAPERPYADDFYHPFAWRGWWDFGTGALGDMACHTFNMPFMGVGLKDPVSIQAWTSGHNMDSYPQKSKIKFEFPETEDRPAIPVWWYDGGNEPEESLLNGQKFERNSKGETTGAVIVCEGGVLYSPGDYGQGLKIIDADGNDMPIPDVEFEESPGHFTEFHQSIIGERDRATSNFENYAGPLTETILLGNLAVWAAAGGEGKKIEWDAQSVTATNAPEVMHVVRREYRDGWSMS